jgi:hypothetical protein
MTRSLSPRGSEPEPRAVPFPALVPLTEVFIGRTEELAKLLRRPPSPHSGGRVTIVSGPGGSGKSALLREVCRHAHRSNLYPSGIFWVSAASSASLVRDFQCIVSTCVRPPDRGQTACGGEQSPAEIREAIVGWLSTHSGWLLVVDDAENPGVVQPYLAYGSTKPLGDVVLASRSNPMDLGRLHAAEFKIGLRGLPSDDALSMLVSLQHNVVVTYTDALERLGGKESPECQAARWFVGADCVQGLPLCVQLAAGSVRMLSLSWVEYVAQYQKQQGLVVGMRQFSSSGQPSWGHVSVGAGVSDPASRCSVHRTWAFGVGSLRKLQGLGCAAAEALQLCSLFAADSIPLQLLVRAGWRLPASSPLRQFLQSYCAAKSCGLLDEVPPVHAFRGGEAILCLLWRLGLIALQPGSGESISPTFSVHRLVQRCEWEVLCADSSKLLEVLKAVGSIPTKSSCALRISLGDGHRWDVAGVHVGGLLVHGLETHSGHEDPIRYCLLTLSSDPVVVPMCLEWSLDEIQTALQSLFSVQPGVQVRSHPSLYISAHHFTSMHRAQILHLKYRRQCVPFFLPHASFQADDLVGQ